MGITINWGPVLSGGCNFKTQQGSNSQYLFSVSIVFEELWHIYIYTGIANTEHYYKCLIWHFIFIKLIAFAHGSRRLSKWTLLSLGEYSVKRRHGPYEENSGRLASTRTTRGKFKVDIWEDFEIRRPEDAEACGHTAQGRTLSPLAWKPSRNGFRTHLHRRGIMCSAMRYRCMR